jgi:hypothetical protein
MLLLARASRLARIGLKPIAAHCPVAAPATHNLTSTPALLLRSKMSEESGGGDKEMCKEKVEETGCPPAEGSLPVFEGVSGDNACLGKQEEKDLSGGAEVQTGDKCTYLSKGFTSEIFKIRLGNMPGRMGYNVSTAGGKGLPGRMGYNVSTAGGKGLPGRMGYNVSTAGGKGCGTWGGGGTCIVHIETGCKSCQQR